MKTFGFLLIALICFSTNAMAAHIRGGELTYRFLGAGTAAGTSEYELTLKLYVDCSARGEGQLESTVSFTIFDKLTGQVNRIVAVSFATEEWIRYDPNSNPCILNAPTDVCYRLRYYRTTVTLPNMPDGYTVAFQRCCRIDNIRNVSGNSGDIGATYSCDIPGTKALASAPANSSPNFNPNDAIAICVGTQFNFDFSAVDQDKDSLVYNLCNAFVGGGREPGSCFSCTSPAPASTPPFEQVSYSSGYGGSSPLGNNVTINSKTGLISGIAPPSVGQYVVTVCVNEYRGGILINTHRKDIHIAVSNCQPLKALLSPDYSFCDDFNVSFQNGQVNPSGATYIWNFGDGSKADTVSTALGLVQHQYADSGTYNVKLKVILAGGQCQDSTTTLAKVYPGFFPGFLAQGSCLLTPFNFRDTSGARYGSITKWAWNFGDETTDTDVSTIRNPSYKYNSLGIKTVTLNVESSKGCKGTFQSTVEVRDRPTLTLPFRDTLICSIDTLGLIAQAPGTLNPQFSWSPAGNILNSNSPNPLVYPKTTTRYTVLLTDNGCSATDSVLVRVVNQVTLSAMPDTTICLTDPVLLSASGDALRYAWSPASQVDNPAIRTPLATPAGNTVYTVTGYIGGCSATEQINVRTIPYPLANAGEDVFICHDDSLQINATINGSAFTWSPSSTLSDPASLSPIAFPKLSTAYVLTVTDNLGCPKPGRDTILVGVRPVIRAFAGNDTAIVVGQPLQLNATGADIYLWEPSFGLNFTNIPDPVAQLSQNQTYSVRVSTPEDCFAYDTINITVFRTNPDIFVPNAFTPGKNTNFLFKPRPVGISQFDFFRVYNRWGQMVFSTSEAGRGWDGRIAGVEQGTGTYVWMAQGRDFTGKTIFKKGTVVLIR